MKTTPPIIWFVFLFSSTLIPLSAGPVTPASMTPEYSAVLRGADVRKLREALDRGASAKAPDALANTPLMQAALYGDLSCLRFLLDRGDETVTR